MTASVGLQSIIDKTFAASIAVVRDSCKYSVGRTIVLICFNPDFCIIRLKCLLVFRLLLLDEYLDFWDHLLLSAALAVFLLLLIIDVPSCLDAIAPCMPPVDERTVSV